MLVDLKLFGKIDIYYWLYLYLILMLILHQHIDTLQSSITSESKEIIVLHIFFFISFLFCYQGQKPKYTLKDTNSIFIFYIKKHFAKSQWTTSGDCEIVNRKLMLEMIEGHLLQDMINLIEQL